MDRPWDGWEAEEGWGLAPGGGALDLWRVLKLRRTTERGKPILLKAAIRRLLANSNRPTTMMVTAFRNR